MAKRTLTTAIAMLMAVALTAANIVKGRVLDENTQKGIDFANVSLTRQGESAPSTGTTTDENGYFKLEAANGTYVLKVSFIGYTDAEKTVTVNNKAVDAGKIYLREQTQNLGEVEVVGQGSQMRFELDRKIFTVDQNLASAGGSATDALENIPSVDVDQEGNISLRNSENVEIWINGKPAGLTSENRADVLKQMPAESIKEIEVITNPSAKFSPEGTAGIINLVMKKDRKAGYYGSVNVNADYALSEPWTTPPGGRGGVNLNFSKSIVDGYINAGYHYHTSNGRSINDRYNFDVQENGDSIVTRLKKNGTNTHKGGGMFLRGGLDLHVTERSTIGLSGFGMISPQQDKTGGWFSMRRNNTVDYELYDVPVYAGANSEDNKETLTDTYSRNERGKGGHPGGSGMIDWRFEISKEHKLSMSGQYMQFGWSQDMYYDQQGKTTEEGHSSYLTTEEQTTDNTDRMVQLKADYEWKPTAKSRLEAGWQTDLAWRKTNSQAWDCGTYYDGATGTDTRISELKDYYNDFRNEEQTHALYVTYGNRWWDKFAVQVGLRGELFKRHIESAYYNESGNRQKETRDTMYFQLFPSVYLSYDFGHGHEMQLNYTRRINRPRGHQINPRQDRSDPTNISYGNPELNPQYSSAVELNYLKNWERHTLSAGLFYRYAEKVTQNIRYRDAEIMRNTYINLGTRHEAGVELVAKNRLFKELLQMTTSVNFYYNRMDKAVFTPVLNGKTYDEVTVPEQNIFAWSARMNLNFLFTKTFSGQISGRYRSPRVVAQGTSGHSYSIDLGLRKTFLNNTLALQLNVRDLLDSRARKNTTSGEGFVQYQENRWHSRTIGIGLTYNFGNMKAKRNDKKDSHIDSAADSYSDQGTDD
ncbi:MAG: TonB-dependent receptor [Paludibacteraceae bacterium]|nr:TonB-dependent receptor [Paludibacteraceae bacterium]